MKLKILGLAVFIATAAAIALYPGRNDTVAAIPPAPSPAILPAPTGVNQTAGAAKIEVVFALDTTGSMSGLIQAAKEKIWSIATTMASAKPTPEIRIGLVAYRDRGDAYVTQVIDLSDDLDSVYAALMDFEAAGGGDTPESVNEALAKAIHEISWSEGEQAYQVVFLVGDAPPHMDYQDDTKFPVTLAAAERRGIFVNTIKCGEHAGTVAPWQRIAQLGHGRFFEVDQAGSAVALATPYDEQIATLSAELDKTRMYFGSDKEKKKMQAKVSATRKLTDGSSVMSQARRAVFNVSAGGRKNLLGEKELVDAVASGRVDIATIDKDALPAELQSLTTEQQKERLEKAASTRNELRAKIQKLGQERRGYLDKKIEADGGAKDSLDRQLFEVVSTQADDAGLKYDDGPQY